MNNSAKASLTPQDYMKRIEKSWLGWWRWWEGLITGKHCELFKPGPLPKIKNKTHTQVQNLQQRKPWRAIWFWWLEGDKEISVLHSGTEDEERLTASFLPEVWGIPAFYICRQASSFRILTSVLLFWGGTLCSLDICSAAHIAAGQRWCCLQFHLSPSWSTNFCLEHISPNVAICSILIESYSYSWNLSTARDVSTLIII